LEKSCVLTAFDTHRQVATDSADAALRRTLTLLPVLVRIDEHADARDVNATQPELPYSVLQQGIFVR
jgi:hypothetical protein